MRRNHKWEEVTEEEYVVYLENLDPDIIPMEFQEFILLKIRDEEYELAEMYT